MRRYLLDTGIVGDYVNRRLGVHERVRQVMARGDRVGVAMPVVGELHAGIELSASRDVNLARLRRALDTLFIWPFDYAAAVEYGHIFASLRRAGRPIPQIDIQIAAVAKSLGNCTVVTKDQDMHHVPGLDLENWAS